MSPEQNWGRWGAEDERGCMNLIGPGNVLGGLATVREGRVLELGHVIGSSRSPTLAGRRATTQHYMLRDGGDPESDDPRDLSYAEDALSLYVHATTTHIDALAHGWARGRLYNGFPSSEVTSRGAARCGMEKLGSAVTRGVLLDLPRLHGVDALAVDHSITRVELSAAAEGAGTVNPGDAVLVRTGWNASLAAKPHDIPLEHPGLVGDAVDWLAERDVALVAGDTLALERVPSPDGGFSPLHVPLLRDLGLPVLELLDLEQLAREERAEFCFVVAPLRIQGGTGSPVCPLAIL